MGISPEKIFAFTRGPWCRAYLRLGPEQFPSVLPNPPLLIREGYLIPVYVIKTKVVFLKGRLLSSQSEQFKKYSKSLIGWKKSAPQKSHFCFDHVNKLSVCYCSVLVFYCPPWKFFCSRSWLLGPVYTWLTLNAVKLNNSSLVEQQPITLVQKFFGSVTRHWAGTTLSVKFSKSVYFLRNYDLFDFTLVRWAKWINRNFSPKNA